MLKCRFAILPYGTSVNKKTHNSMKKKKHFARKSLKYVLFLIPAVLLGYYFCPEAKLPEDASIDRIVVLKSERKMQVYSGENLLKTYPISLGFAPVGAKEVEGDGKTPEGIYQIESKNPHSGYYKNLGISYPSEQDRERAEKLGQSPGGDIKIHGLPKGRGAIGKFHRYFDWTAGCIALTNPEMEEIYKHTAVGCRIEIRP